MPLTIVKPPLTEDPAVMTAVAEYHRRGLGYREVCARLRISKSTYYRLIGRLKVVPFQPQNVEPPALLRKRSR